MLNKKSNKALRHVVLFCCVVLQIFNCSVFAGAESSQKHIAETTFGNIEYTQHEPVVLFEDGAPVIKNWPGKIDKPVKEISQYDGAVLFNVVNPTITAFLPKGTRKVDIAVFIVPGGGFRQVSIFEEGYDVARWLAQRGIASFVLKYRTVQLPGPQYHLMQRMGEFPTEVAAQPAIIDAKKAMSYLRGNAEKFQINPKKIVAIGFSAGAHVVSHLALNPKIDDRPAYVAAVYGAPFDEKLPAIPAKNSAQALPPFFLVLAQDDVVVGIAVRTFYSALLENGYSPEAHFYMHGNHGFGMRQQDKSSDHFIDAFYWWMQAWDLLPTD